MKVIVRGVEASDLPVVVDPLGGSTSISLYCRCPMLVALLAVVAGILVDFFGHHRKLFRWPLRWLACWLGVVDDLALN